MPSFKHLPFFLTCFLSISLCFAYEDTIENHDDLIRTNQSLSLAKVIELTLEKHPDIQLTSALE